MIPHTIRYAVLSLLTILLAVMIMPDCEDRIRLEDFGETLFQQDFLHQPQWSPDGSLIVFGHHRTVYTVESDGSRLRDVTSDDPPKWIWDDDDGYDVGLSPNISPDGSRVAYVAFKHDRWPWGSDYQWDIVTSKLDGSDRRRLTKSGNNFSPSWSPDGSRIAFMNRWLQVMDSDGSNVRRVADIQVARTTPVWSPDGRRLLFMALEPDSPKTWYDPDMGTWYSQDVVKEVLYTVGVDGTGLTRIGEAAGTPSWSPDGGRIAFARSDSDTHAAIVTMAPDGSNEKTVFESSKLRPTGITEPVFNVSWSPDGTRIAIIGLLTGGGTTSYGRVTVSVIDADGSGPPRLIAALNSGGELSWSPDGSRIAVKLWSVGSPGAALKTLAAVERPEQDEFWYRWKEGEGGRDATPKPTPLLAQTPPSTPTPAPPGTSPSSLIHAPSSESTPACAGGSDASRPGFSPV